jgi:hypothetical protein
LKAGLVGIKCNYMQTHAMGIIKSDLLNVPLIGDTKSLVRKGSMIKFMREQMKVLMLKDDKLSSCIELIEKMDLFWSSMELYYSDGGLQNKPEIENFLRGFECKKAALLSHMQDLKRCHADNADVKDFADKFCWQL